MRDNLAHRRIERVAREAGRDPVVLHPDNFRQAPGAPAPENTGCLTVSLGDVAKRFGERHVLDRIDLIIPAGQFLAVVGRSGGGKTTLLRLIAGLDRPSRGKVAVGGVPVAGLQRNRLPDCRETSDSSFRTPGSCPGSVSSAMSALPGNRVGAWPQ
jgi:ABC-type multidrug transport system fused ATPase/permease subunit